MTVLQRRILSSVLGMALLLLILLIVSLSSLLQPEERPVLTINEVELYAPPPPPPPPPAAQNKSSSESRPNVLQASVAPALELVEMDLDVQIESGGFEGEGIQGIGDFMGTGLGTVDIASLDRLPEVLNSPSFTVPKDILEQDIEFVEVRLHILIDEEGRAYFVDVLETTYPAYNQYIPDYVSKVRFTEPTMQGVPVRAQYIWPVKFMMR